LNSAGSVGLDPKIDERCAVAFAQKASAVGDVGFNRDRAGALDAGADRHLLEIDAEAGMALLPAGLAVVAVVDAEDRQVRRIDHRDGGERADVHKELSVAGDDEDALVRPRQREPEPHHAGRAHRAAERIDVGAVAGDRADVAGAASQAGDEQEILVAPDQRRHRFAPLEHEARRGGRCKG
jgi:hypothetical protein